MSHNRPSDSWEGPSSGFPVVAPPPRGQGPVKDDWDDDDTDDEEDDPQQVWEAANKKAPMPEVVIAAASAAPAVPTQALQPSMRILKRSSAAASTSQSSTPSANAQQKSLAEREAQYQAARERIFGNTVPGDGHGAAAESRGGLSSPSVLSTPPRTTTNPTPPLRHPRGADSAPTESEAGSKGSGGSRGFQRRGTNPNPRNVSTRGR